MTSVRSPCNGDLKKSHENMHNTHERTNTNVSIGNNTSSALSQRYEQLLESEKYADCIFHVDGRTLKGHKLILSAASPVFEAMLYGPLQEQNGIIDILDVTPDIFNKFLHYIYMGSISFDTMSLEELFELYYCGEKYLLKELITDCLHTITQKLCYSNILQALELAITMDFDTLVEMCIMFLSNYCLNDTMFLAYHKRNYYHISKECVKAIITANKCSPDHLLWFVYEWCQHECNDMSLQKEDCLSFIQELNLQEAGVDCPNILSLKSVLQQRQSLIPAKRIYYKACRPFRVDHISHEWKFVIRSDRYVSLHGLIIHGRLTPSTLIATSTLHKVSNTYSEMLELEITAPIEPDVRHPVPDGPYFNEQATQTIWQQKLQNDNAKYNLDSCISWPTGVTLSPNIPYQIKINWPASVYGAEYPCCIQSNSMNGIFFFDLYPFCGSLVKGVYYKELI